MLMEMKAVVMGHDCEGKFFTEKLTFKLIPPRKDEQYYGTGYMLEIQRGHRREYCDVRYQRTKNIDILAERYIEAYYGKNAETLIKIADLTKDERSE